MGKKQEVKRGDLCVVAGAIGRTDPSGSLSFVVLLLDTHRAC